MKSPFPRDRLAHWFSGQEDEIEHQKNKRLFEIFPNKQPSVIERRASHCSEVLLRVGFKAKDCRGRNTMAGFGTDSRLVYYDLAPGTPSTFVESVLDGVAEEREFLAAAVIGDGRAFRRFGSSGKRNFGFLAADGSIRILPEKISSKTA